MKLDHATCIGIHEFSRSNRQRLVRIDPVQHQSVASLPKHYPIVRYNGRVASIFRR
ncbi:uncharacterized protein P884DRAFT_9083 [Thermothelomyces heterothallicus CBS 202.75]|uniref:uncharacterized protein n=1 Tax=Thermothelomyces heterothallicus CBS 202.75 TaxID=1149848 RepID=UPI0037449CFF